MRRYYSCTIAIADRPPRPLVPLGASGPAWAGSAASLCYATVDCMSSRCDGGIASGTPVSRDVNEEDDSARAG